MLVCVFGCIGADSSVLATLAVDARGNFPEIESEGDFIAELQQNVDDHEIECARSCRSFFCGPAAPFEAPAFASYSMGPVPSNDLPSAFDGEQQIFVTEQPIF